MVLLCDYLIDSPRNRRKVSSNSNNGKHHDYDRETEKLRRYEF